MIFGIIIGAIPLVIIVISFIFDKKCKNKQSVKDKRKFIMKDDYNDFYEVDAYPSDGIWSDDFVKAYCEYHEKMKQKYPELYLNY